MLLMALESLYKDASEQDVRLGLLRTNLQILQRHGQLDPSLIQVLSQLSCTTETVQHPGEARPFHCRECVTRESVHWLPTGMLHPSGEQLSVGWEPVLRILEVVPEAEDAACVSLAFQSVQLLASDYMSSLPPPLLHKCLQAAALYGGQQVNAVFPLMPLLKSPHDGLPVSAYPLRKLLCCTAGAVRSHCRVHAARV